MKNKIYSFLLVWILSLAFLPSIVNAAWTVDVSVADVKGNYVIYKVACTSDGDALAATDLVALMTSNEKEYVIKGATAMVMNIDPGTGGAAPTATIDITFTDIAGIAIFAETGFANGSDTVGQSMSVDLGQYPVITSQWNLAINDIGDASDTVTLYLYCWVEGR